MWLTITIRVAAMETLTEHVSTVLSFFVCDDFCCLFVLLFCRFLGAIVYGHYRHLLQERLI